MKPLVSVIIPLYNAEPYIAETIECILQQTYDNIEVVIVDDGSTDNSLAIAKFYESNRISVIAQENKGASAARNLGLKIAKGHFIQFLDADDLLPEGKIEKQVEVLANRQNTVSSCSWARFKQHPTVYTSKINPIEFRTKNYTTEEYVLADFTTLIHCWLIPKQIIDKVGYWDESLNYDDDGEFFMRILAKSREVYFIKDLVVLYRSGNHASLSHFNSLDKAISALKAIESYENSLRHIIVDTVIRNKFIANRYRRLQFLCYPRYINVYNQLTNKAVLQFATEKFNPGGKINRIIAYLFGWKLVRILKDKFNR